MAKSTSSKAKSAKKQLLPVVGIIMGSDSDLKIMRDAAEVIGVPVKSSNSIDGWDSILSILQMPNGVPVATVALNAAKNAGILAAEILGTSSIAIRNKIIAYKMNMQETVIHKAKKIEKDGYKSHS
ncbi:MAG: AIR carboxylase family protein [Bacteroidetes bacterium]|nr:AIR carboxylase family protein [Bacteroidota bacterium]